MSANQLYVVTLLFVVLSYLICLACDVRQLRRELQMLRKRGKRSVGYAPVSFLTTCGKVVATELIALQYQQESLAWELEVATRDIVRRSSLEIGEVTRRASTREELDSFLKTLSSEFRHSGLVVASSDGFWHHEGRIGAHFRRAFEHCYKSVLQGLSETVPVDGVFEPLGFCEALVTILRIEGTPTILWLGYSAERPPTDTERKRFPILVREFSTALSISNERKTLSHRVSAAEQRTETHTKLIAEVSHDIRSPLSNLKAILNVLRLEGMTTDTPQLLDVAVGNCEAMDEIITALIDLSRVHAGTLNTRMELLDISAIIDAVVTSFKVTARIKNIELRYDHSEVLPYIKADRTHVRRILTNLLSNAFKYTERGEVTVRALADNDNRLKIEVSDTGRGMTPQQVSELFTPFTRFHSEMAEGIGLGLTLTRSLVEMNAGLITVQSSAGHGSTFTLSFPAMNASSSKSLPTNSRSGGKRVLLVDDDRDCVDTLERALGNSCYVRKAYGVDEAIRWLQGGDVDIVVSDARMPNGGIESLLDHIVRFSLPVRVIVLTGDLNHADVLLNKGARHVLQKPVDVPELIQIINADVEKLAAPAAA